eukprot:8320157-Ditylum_brightwellii.AAC.1
MAKDVIYLLNYAASHPHAVIRYTVSGMTLHIHSGTSYMSETCIRSRAGGHFFLSSKPKDPTKWPTEHILLTRLVHSVCKVIWNGMASSSEAEIAALYTKQRRVRN